MLASGVTLTSSANQRNKTLASGARTMTRCLTAEDANHSAIMIWVKETGDVKSLLFEMGADKSKRVNHF